MLGKTIIALFPLVLQESTHTKQGKGTFQYLLKITKTMLMTTVNEN